jgi:hypothetical protein
MEMGFSRRPQLDPPESRNQEVGTGTPIAFQLSRREHGRDGWSRTNGRLCNAVAFPCRTFKSCTVVIRDMRPASRCRANRVHVAILARATFVAPYPSPGAMTSASRPALPPANVSLNPCSMIARSSAL